ncbi:hypothetical protein NC981_23405 [Leptolyngbya sp. DQ-M1]|uniref:hypothetical protein n=1 Tax=Leptolyngbya sp. DQ-M1 TaxID=2933920 RepID=UPI003299FC9F
MSANEEKPWVKIAIATIGIIGTIGTSLVANEVFWKQFSNHSPEAASKATPSDLKTQDATVAKTTPNDLKAQDFNAQRRALIDFTKLADEFDRLPNKEERIKADRVIRQVAKSLTLNDIQPYSRESRRWGHRASAGTAIAGLLAASPALVEQEYDRLIEIITYNLRDPISYVRYRYLTVLEENPKLAQHFRRELLDLSEKDSNPRVKEKAQRTVKRLF